MTTQTLARPQLQTAAGLINRYLLPKVALGIISVAALVGTYLTMTTHGAGPAQAPVRWLFLVALGTLAGGTMWWGFFLRPPQEAGERAAVAAFAAASVRRFRRIGGAALVAVALTAPHLAWLYDWAVRAGETPLWLAGLSALVLAWLSTAWLLWRSREGDVFRRWPVRWSWAWLALALVLTALLDARLTFPHRPSAWVLRPLHLLAFGLWFGGAVWNIFIAVPAARETLALPVVVAAAQHLERFRRTVRVILPTLLITGLLQALPYTGFNLHALLFSSFGQLILLKLGLIVALVGIFITCPMWRACSPIRGLCDLEDLEARPAPPIQPVQRLDNRGKSCAGFVHIQRALEAMQPGEVLELLSSDPISWWELPAWLEKHGHRLLLREKQGRLWWRWYRFLIEKGAYHERGDVPIRSFRSGLPA